MNSAATPTPDLLTEMALACEAPARAPTMGNLKKVRYSHSDMIDFIITHPGCTQREMAQRYGYSEGWISNIMASDAWQAAYAARREEVIDPTIAATVEERFRGMAILSLKRLQEKLEQPTVPDNVVLRAVELGAKACNIGGRMPIVNSEGQTIVNIFTPENLAHYANAKLTGGRILEGT